MRVLFLHGREGSPQGEKSRWLASRWDAWTPSYDTSDVATGLVSLRTQLADAGKFDLVIGSSFGGAMLAGLQAEGVLAGPAIFLAPAFLLLTGGGAPSPSLCPSTHRSVVVHGWGDTVVPITDSVAFASHRERTLLMAGPWDHRLSATLQDGTLVQAVHWVMQPEG